MPLPHVDYRMVKTVAEALALKQAHPDARFLAGGTDLIPQVREGRRPTSLFIDIKRIPELSRIEERPDGGVLVGAAVTMATIADRLGQRFPLLTECCLTVGAFPLRNRATMGGNLCNASPAADTAVGLMCLDAEVVAQGPAGVRHVPITEFFQGPGRTALLPLELVLGIVLPPSASSWRGSYLRMSRRLGMDLATLGVVVACNRDGGRARHRIALAAVAPTPLRVPDAEAVLDALGTTPDACQKAGEIAAAACRPITDNRGTETYRRDMVGVLVTRGAQALNASTEAAR